VLAGGQGIYPVIYLPLFFPPLVYHPSNAPNSPREHSRKNSLPSCPGSASGCNGLNFPNISIFFEEVSGWPEARNQKLDDIEAKLTSNTIYQIDELENMSAEKLSKTFHLLWVMHNSWKK